MEKGNICKVFSVKSDNLQNTIICGYASVFNVIDSQNDLVEKGAFRSTIPDNIKLLWQHDSLKPIGVIKSIYEDNYGLKVEAEINNKITHGKEATELVKQGAVDGLSIGFCVNDFEYNDQGTRLLKKVDLMEVSIVTFPSNRNANITHVKTKDMELIEQYVKKLESRFSLLVKKLSTAKQEEICNLNIKKSSR